MKYFKMTDGLWQPSKVAWLTSKQSQMTQCNNIVDEFDDGGKTCYFVVKTNYSIGQPCMSGEPVRSINVLKIAEELKQSSYEYVEIREFKDGVEKADLKIDQFNLTTCIITKDIKSTLLKDFFKLPMSYAPGITYNVANTYGDDSCAKVQIQPNGTQVYREPYFTPAQYVYLVTRTDRGSTFVETMQELKTYVKSITSKVKRIDIYKVAEDMSLGNITVQDGDNTCYMTLDNTVVPKEVLIGMYEVYRHIVPTNKMG